MRAGRWLTIVLILSIALTGVPLGESTGSGITPANSIPGIHNYRAQSPVPAGVFVRTSIFKLMDSNPSAIDSLRRGVQVMHGRQCTNPNDPTNCDPTGWVYQANMHGTYAASGTALWNQCQHGSFYFFSWHRMYLYYFERILRAASGDPKFALPYWNYTDDPARQDPNQRQLPLPFRQPADPTNSLYVPNRAGPMNDGTGYLPKADVDYSNAFRFTNFDSLPGSGSASFGGGTAGQPSQFNGDYGQLELTPHNVVHVDIGGSQGFQCAGGWMIDVNCAARDPIFFLHHANIDRLWKRWLDQGGGRQNPVNDQVWMNTVFTFYDETGQRVQISGKGILDTVAQLGYCYDDDPACGGPPPNPPSGLTVIVH
jgi:tyrosinase